MATVNISDKEAKEIMDLMSEHDTEPFALLWTENQINSASSVAFVAAANAVRPSRSEHWTARLSAQLDRMEPVHAVR